MAVRRLCMVVLALVPAHAFAQDASPAGGVAAQTRPEAYAACLERFAIAPDMKETQFAKVLCSRTNNVDQTNTLTHQPPSIIENTLGLEQKLRVQS